MPAPSKRITTRSMTLGRPQTPKAHSKRRAPDATNQDRGKAAKKKRTHSDDLPEESPPELKPEHAKWIHPANVNSYQIYANNPLSIIFDPVSPCRIFVPGETYSDNERMPFADPSDNMTYVDSGDSNPIKPSTFKCAFSYLFDMKAANSLFRTGYFTVSLVQWPQSTITTGRETSYDKSL